MMHQKALLFSDQTIANEILQTNDPATQQQLGRKISSFDATQWDQHKLGIVWYGNYLKFSQHPDLAQRLLATDDKILAEASPYDLIWGIGYAASDDRAIDKNQWRGQNLLGEVLMSVRGILKVGGC
ncbi:MAG: NADAR family protein, partial [Bacteroidota bacterium]